MELFSISIYSDELIFGADLKVVTGLRLSVAHGILLHSHKSSVLVSVLE